MKTSIDSHDGGISTGSARSADILAQARRALMPILLIGECVLFALVAPGFMTSSNVTNIIVNSTDLAIVAAGLTLVILTAGIDLSIGAMVGVVSWLVAWLIVGGASPVLTIAVALAAGAILGAVNGGLVTLGKVSPIIATLGTGAVFAAIQFGLWGSEDILSPPVLSAMGPHSRFWGLPTVLLIVLALYGILVYVLKYQRFGRHLYAIGNDAAGARLLGIKVNRTVFLSYVAAGAFVGLASLIYIGRVGAAQAYTGQELLLPAIAAVMVGGTSILGGFGGVARTLGGLAFIAILQNGVVLLGIPSLWNNFMVGAAIALAITIDVLGARAARKSTAAR
jgi:ribose/xylose/arabinose/galactoside ABC-type transport system permease subunit